MSLPRTTLALNLLCFAAATFASQTSPPDKQVDIATVPPLMEILGKTYEWTVENLGQPVGPVEWMTSKARPDRGGKQITFGRQLFVIKDKSLSHGTRTLQAAFTGVEAGPKLVTSVEWNDLGRLNFDQAFKANGLTLTDFEMVNERKLAPGWDVTTLRNKKDKKVLLELTRTESSYRIKLLVEADLEFFEKRKSTASPL